MRSMRNKEEELVEEMNKYRLDSLGVSKTHLRGCGERQVGEAAMVFSGVMEGIVKGGVAVVVREVEVLCEEMEV